MKVYEDAKAGDMITTRYTHGGGVHSQAVIIGLPTGETRSGGHLGLNPSTIGPGVMCYRIFGDIDSSDSGTRDTGYFLTLNSEQWDRGAEEDHTPFEQCRERSIKLLRKANEEMSRPVHFGTTLDELGLHKGNAKEVFDTVNTLIENFS